MRLVVQRVRHASVSIDSTTVGEIGRGLCVLLGIAEGDSAADSEYLCNKVATLRIFDDSAGQMNHSLEDIAGELLIVSQFTLYADCRKGRRPSFMQAMHPDRAEQLYEHFIAQCQKRSIHVETGTFGANMAVEISNLGPVTLLLDSKKMF